MSQAPAPLTTSWELEEQLELVTQKAGFLYAVVNVLKNDYWISVIKSDQASPHAKNRPKK
ncbi:hypothetical protein [Serratia marcescens]|uniref:hypothetical protein n=1 Tax=Serratia marcescens TaxID=615 RepID=UPI0007450533|nr:hypothetical protein [Serratia marcescens]CUY66154.1 Uncharacterised protein [Serratia marcescens]